MRRLFLAFILKNNGALAGLCIFFLVVAASIQVIHGKLESASFCQASPVELSQTVAKASVVSANRPSAAACLRLVSRQNPTFNFLERFFFRS